MNKTLTNRPVADPGSGVGSQSRVIKELTSGVKNTARHTKYCVTDRRFTAADTYQAIRPQSPDGDRSMYTTGNANPLSDAAQYDCESGATDMSTISPTFGDVKMSENQRLQTKHDAPCLYAALLAL